MARKKHSDAPSMSPLAAFIQQKLDAGDTYAQMAARANHMRSDEFFRQTRQDQHKGPLKGRTITALALGLEVGEAVIRRLDDARWRDGGTDEVYRARDTSALGEIVRELRSAADQQARTAERMQRAIAALADELDAGDSE